MGLTCARAQYREHKGDLVECGLCQGLWSDMNHGEKSKKNNCQHMFLFTGSMVATTGRNLDRTDTVLMTLKTTWVGMVLADMSTN